MQELRKNCRIADKNEKYDKNCCGKSMDITDNKYCFYPTTYMVRLSYILTVEHADGSKFELLGGKSCILKMGNDTDGKITLKLFTHRPPLGVRLPVGNKWASVLWAIHLATHR